MDCTIIIFHYELFEFLLGCIREIRKYKHPNIEQHIIIADQSGIYTHRKVHYTFSENNDITIVRIPQIDSGYSVDWIVRNMNIRTKYLCILDCDAFPVHKNWLYLPVKLIEKYNLSFAGVGYSSDYIEEYKKHGDFFVMRSFYNIGHTELFKTLSHKTGFTRNENRKFTGFNYEINEWNGYSDCGVMAYWYEDKLYKNNKLSFGETKRIGETPMQGTYGNIFGDLVFHFGQSNNYKSFDKQLQLERYGKEYLQWIDLIDKNGLTEEIISELLSAAKPKQTRNTTYLDGNGKDNEYWDGTEKRIKQLSEEIKFLNGNNNRKPD